MTLAAVLGSSVSLLAQPDASDMQVFSGATIHTVSGEVIENGSLVVSNGKISAVGSTAAMALPADATFHDVSGKVIIPGLVDTHSHIGNSPRPSVPAHRDHGESSNPVSPQLRALDAIWPGDPGIRMALAGGITTANIMPGSGNVIGGQTAYVKLRGDTIEDMLIEGSPGGLKMANGENPKRNYGSRNQAPMTRMAIAALARQAYLDAQAYVARQDNRGRRDPEPARDLGLEALAEVLAGTRMVHHHTHRADDILTVLRLRDEFDFRLVIQHGTEAWKVADQLAAANIPVSMIIIDAPGGKHEAAEFTNAGAAILDQAGVKLALHTDDFINSSRFLLREAGLAIRYGLPPERALLALTQNPADMLDLGDRIGSLEPGKDADFVVLSGEPFSVYTKVEQTWIEGEKVFDLSHPMDRLYATGGFGIADRYPPSSEIAGGAR